MTDLSLLAVLAMFAGVTTVAFRYNNPMILSVVCGFIASLLIGSLFHIGMYYEASTTLSVLGLGFFISPVLALEFSEKKAFISSNTVLLSRDSFAGMSLNTAKPVAPRTAAAHVCAA